VQFAAKNKKPGGDRMTEKGICPTMIDVPRKEESRHCIECFRCVKPSSPGGLFLKFRHPGEEIEQIRNHHPNLAEVWFLFLGTGAVLGGFLWLVLPSFGAIRQNLGAWLINQGQYWIGNPGPWWLMSVHPDRREVFNWLDFGMIVGYMGFWTLAAVVVLGLTTLLCAWLSGRCGGTPGLRQRFTELGYQYAPVAMFSLIIGLGGELFTPLANIGLGTEDVALLKGALLSAALVWSVYLGYRILQNQGVSRRGRWLSLLPGVTGSLAVASAWWPAIVG